MLGLNIEDGMTPGIGKLMEGKETAQKRRVVLTGGGTGGHVYPSLAIYHILKNNDFLSEALYLGSAGRAEERIVPRHGIPLEFESGAHQIHR